MASLAVFLAYPGYLGCLVVEELVGERGLPHPAFSDEGYRFSQDNFSQFGNAFARNGRSIEHGNTEFLLVPIQYRIRNRFEIAFRDADDGRDAAFLCEHQIPVDETGLESRILGRCYDDDSIEICRD